MSSIRDRQEGFEKKFAMDEESKFKAMARRNKLLGIWAAEKLGKTGADADAYAKEVAHADFEEAGDDDVFRKVRADFDAAGVAQSDHQIRHHGRIAGDRRPADQDRLSIHPFLQKPSTDQFSLPIEYRQFQSWYSLVAATMRA
jgi:hypothetical protein